MKEYTQGQSDASNPRRPGTGGDTQSHVGGGSGAASSSGGKGDALKKDGLVFPACSLLIDADVLFLKSHFRIPTPESPPWRRIARRSLRKDRRGYKLIRPCRKLWYVPFLPLRSTPLLTCFVVISRSRRKDQVDRGCQEAGWFRRWWCRLEGNERTKGRRPGSADPTGQFITRMRSEIQSLIRSPRSQGGNGPQTNQARNAQPPYSEHQ